MEESFNPKFAAGLALREKAIQQNYRPIVGIHKWFARRPGTVFRSLLLAEFNGEEPLEHSYWRSHNFSGVIADPFMGGGTPTFESCRLGFSVIATDTNPMAFWVVRQSLVTLDLDRFAEEASSVARDVESQVAGLYQTRCLVCDQMARVKYFLWVKTERCPCCGLVNDLFPGYLLAEAKRHPRHVLVCSECGELNEYESQPTRLCPVACFACGHNVYRDGAARRQHVTCRRCKSDYRYPTRGCPEPPDHRMWAIEYYCEACKPIHEGRFFKKPDQEDLRKFLGAQSALAQVSNGLPIPNEDIPAGDETDRLRRWGYRYYRQMFNDRQLLSLGLLLQRITKVEDREVRYALLTVFSDCLRYQNMLCRYDTYALKCQDIFSVHGFPVGLVQCENNALGIPKVGSGAFRHFVEKYLRAKRYCARPFETRHDGRRKKLVYVAGERISPELTDRFPEPASGQASIGAAPASSIALPPESLDGIFTDPPYFGNVQYAELMDFCYVWLRQGLKDDFKEFLAETTRSSEELTGNVTLGRGIERFTQGLAAIFRNYAEALKLGAPLVFTYHHNDLDAYVAVVVAILDAGLDCTATLPVVGEMSASLHIAGTGSSRLDTVFVCRRGCAGRASADLEASLRHDVTEMKSAGVKVGSGDIRCLAFGQVARIAVSGLREAWDPEFTVADKMSLARQEFSRLSREVGIESLVSSIIQDTSDASVSEEAGNAAAI